jgi:hypothetical protein
MGTTIRATRRVSFMAETKSGSVKLCKKAPNPSLKAWMKMLRMGINKINDK